MANTVGSKIFNRVGHIELSVNGKLYQFYGLDFKFNIKKNCSGLSEDRATIHLLGLSRDSVNHFATFNDSASVLSQGIEVKVYAGYKEQTGEALIFDGDAELITPSQPVNNWLVIKAQVHGRYHSNIISFAKNGIMTIKDLIESFAKEFGFIVGYRTNSKVLNERINGFDCSGDMQDILRRINLLTTIRVYDSGKKIDNIDGSSKTGLLLVGDDDPNKIKGSKIYEMSYTSGMIGMPQFSYPYVIVTSLINTAIKPFDAIYLRSVMNPKANGYYVIYDISYVGHFRGDEWYMKMKCRSLDEYKNKIKGNN